jgi:phage terminase small subunit
MSASQAGSQLLGKLGAEIAAAQSEHLKRLDLTADQVLRELARIGFSNIRHLFNEDNTLRPIHTLDEQTAAVITSFEQDPLFSGSGKAREQIGVTQKVKLWDKVRALTTLARHFRLLEPGDQDRKRPLKIIITDAPAVDPRVVNGAEGTENDNITTERRINEGGRAEVQ